MYSSWLAWFADRGVSQEIVCTRYSATDTSAVQRAHMGTLSKTSQEQEIVRTLTLPRLHGSTQAVAGFEKLRQPF